MALGKKLFQINYPDFVKGMSSSDVLSDGGFSPLTNAVNLLGTQGAVYQANSAQNVSGLTGQMIASCEDPSGTYARLYVSSDTGPQDGRFWSLSTGIALTQRGSTDSSANYIQGRTDMIAAFGEAYTTTDATIVRWSSIGSSNTFDFSFVTGLNSFVPHPALFYNSFAYYGNGNVLLRQSAAGVAPSAILTLPAGVVIVALGVDPGSGRMLMSLIGQPNISDTVNSGCSVAFYDGFSPQVDRYVQVDDMVTAFPSTEGALYAAYGQSLGLWNGSGITYLRTMNVDFDNTQLMYKHHFTSIGSTLYVIEKTKIIAYGPVRQKGPNVFYPALSGANNLTNIVNIGQNILTLSFATSQLFTLDVKTAGDQYSTLSFYSNSTDFDDEYWIRRIRIIFATNVPNNISPGNIQLINESGLIAVGGDGSGIYGLTNTSGTSLAFKDLLNVNQRVKMLQLNVMMGQGNYGIRRVIVYGEPANQTGSPN